MTRKKLLTRKILLSGIMKSVQKKTSFPFVWSRQELAVKRVILQEMQVRLLSREEARMEGIVIIRGSWPVVRVIDGDRAFIDDLFVFGVQTKWARSTGGGSIGVQQELFSREDD